MSQSNKPFHNLICSLLFIDSVFTENCNSIRCMLCLYTKPYGNSQKAWLMVKLNTRYTWWWDCLCPDFIIIYVCIAVLIANNNIIVTNEWEPFMLLLNKKKNYMQKMFQQLTVIPVKKQKQQQQWKSILVLNLLIQESTLHLN